MTETEFRTRVLKRCYPKHYAVSGSLGVYDAYKYIRKNGWYNIGLRLTEHLFYSIIRKVGLALADYLVHGGEFTLPKHMGKLYLKKDIKSPRIVDGKLVCSLPIDWDRTLKLWYEDEEAYKNRTLIKQEVKEVFQVRYDKEYATYNNQMFYEFKTNRDIKVALKRRIKSNKLDAYLL